MNKDQADETKPDEAVSPMEAQNTGPEHQGEPGAQERDDARSPRSEDAELRRYAITPGGEPESRDDG